MPGVSLTIARRKTEQAIEQARFSGIRRAVDDDAHAFAKDAALVRGREQRVDLRANFVEPREKCRPDIGRDVFVRKIDVGLEIGDERNQVFAQLRNFFAQPAFQLFRRGAEREIGLGADQIDDRFGLRQIQFAVEKSALGEFPGPSRPRARVQAGFPNPRRHQHAAVATDFDHIFAGVTRRGAMDREHHLIDDPVLGDDFAELLQMR